jgi:hypothetical protein
VGGFAAETAAAATLFLATCLGHSVSTTHTITGSIMASAPRGGSPPSGGHRECILVAWLLTMPAAAAIRVLNLPPDSGDRGFDLPFPAAIACAHEHQLYPRFVSHSDVRGHGRGRGPPAAQVSRRRFFGSVGFLFVSLRVSPCSSASSPRSIFGTFGHGGGVSQLNKAMWGAISPFSSSVPFCGFACAFRKSLRPSRVLLISAVGLAGVVMDSLLFRRLSLRPGPRIFYCR